MFLPSIDEVCFMLDPGRGPVPPDEVAGELLALGAALVMLKLGERGLYLRASSDPARLSFMERLGQDPAVWAGLEIREPAFQVEVAGTTGCGDSTVAGFLAALVRGLGPREALTVAAAVGACTAERRDALSGVPSWEALQDRLASPWARLT
jgi:sugar/nucleoside kinase (ribokinase family)